MSFNPVPRQPSSSDDPLARLRRRIERARRPQVDPSTQLDTTNGDDPLERLHRRIDQASSPDQLERMVGPLARLYERFRRARLELEEPTGYPREVDTADPLERLADQLEDEAETIGGRSSVEPRRASGADEVAGPSTGPGVEGAATALGREVTHMLEQSDLPGPVRAEAARRLASTIDDPDPAALREVLRLLVTGEQSE